MVLARRQALFALAAGGVGFLVSAEANATLALALSLEELVTQSHGVVFGTPLERSSQWETIGGGRRIVTTTRVRIDEPLVGSSDSERLVRTLGGKVGHIGQIVHGEAQLRTGERNLIFLRNGRDGLFVTGRAQGHFPVRPDPKGAERLLRSPRLPELVDAERSAGHQLVGRTVSEARRLVLDAIRKRR